MTTGEARRGSNGQSSAPPPPAPAAEPYPNGGELLHDELRRVDLLVRAATRTWRATLAADKPEHLWGMLHVSEAEVDRYLDAPFALAPTPSDAVSAENAVLLEQSRSLGTTIVARVEATPEPERLPLHWLGLALSLGRHERDALLVALLPSLDARYRRLFGYLQDDASRAAPSAELLLHVLAPTLPSLGAGRSLLAPDGSLRRHRLLHLGGPEEGPLAERPVTVDERIVQYLLGVDALPSALVGRVEEILGPESWDDLEIERATRARLEGALAAWSSAAEQRRPLPVVTLCGPSGCGRRTAALTLCRRAGLAALVVDARQGPDGLDEQRARVELAAREAILRHAALVWIDDGPADGRRDAVVECLERQPGPLVFVTDAMPSIPLERRDRLRIDVSPAGYELRRAAWHRRLEALASQEITDVPRTAELLANAFRLRIGDIDAVLADARGTAELSGRTSDSVAATDLLDACRRRSTSELGSMAARIAPTTELTFDDLVLPAANRRQLDDLRSRIHHRHRVLDELGLGRRTVLSRGLCALFSGGSGTGKTMAARLLARERNVDLYRIDLSAVVSKYVGETEKNLDRVFAEAERANAILFFDEADALFGKRGEIKEARDRWANLEVDFLLQRIEEFEGVVILATNLRQNIDEAFLRRLHCIVDFPAPSAEARQRIWLGLFPEGLARPPDDEIARLARQFSLPGGSIKNVVVDAAFRAVADARDGEPVVELRHLAGALGRELQKLGRPVTSGEFGEDLYPWAEAEVLG